MKILRTIFMLFIMTGGIFMADRYGNSSTEFQEYFSRDPELNIKMEYPSGWRYQEHRGPYGSYAQVQFYGALDDHFAPTIVVTAEPGSKLTLRPLTIEAMADDLTAKRMNFDEAKVLSRGKTRVLGVSAIEMTLSYNQPDRLRSLEFNMTAFKERVVIFQINGRFYTLRYVNTAKRFNEFEPSFLQGIKTFQLK